MLLIYTIVCATSGPTFVVLFGCCGNCAAKGVGPLVRHRGTSHPSLWPIGTFALEILNFGPLAEPTCHCSLLPSLPKMGARLGDDTFALSCPTNPTGPIVSSADKSGPCSANHLRDGEIASRYDISVLLGKGTFAEVKRGRDRKTGVPLFVPPMWWQWEGKGRCHCHVCVRASVFARASCVCLF